MCGNPIEPSGNLFHVMRKTYVKEILRPLVDASPRCLSMAWLEVQFESPDDGASNLVKKNFNELSSHPSQDRKRKSIRS